MVTYFDRVMKILTVNKKLGIDEIMDRMSVPRYKFCYVVAGLKKGMSLGYT